MEGQTKCKTSGATRCEIAKSHSVVIPAEAGIQYSRGSHGSNDRSRRTGYPAFAGYPTAFCGRRSVSLPAMTGAEHCYTGSAIEYFTWLSAKLDSIEAMPSSRVSLFFRNAS